ncbi:chitinase [Streptomyces thinghirensis]
MRAYRKAAAGCALLLALATAGCAGQDDGAGDTGATGATEDRATTAPSEPSAPVTAYAPYVSATTASATDSGGSPATYNLAFVISSGDDCVPRWNGVQDIDDTSVAARVAKLKESGADVRVSFGGASGTELAAACGSAADLAQAYGEALDAAGSTRADFDIEGGALTDTDSVVLRSEAIALLQEERDGLEVSFTLPVMPSGLDADSLTLLASANDHGVQVATVNLMTMNYGESYDGDMGQYALTSAEAAHTQFREVFGTSDADAWRGMALTSMLGVNDVAGETFTLADAAEVRAFAEEKGIAWVSVWATFRDTRCAEDASATDALTTCSGVEQEDGAFGAAFGA